MYYIYILYSESSDRFYIGFSQDPWERVIEHNNDPRNTYTSKHRPWELVTVFSVGENRSDAIIFEKWIKKQKSKTLIQKLINENFHPDGFLAPLNRVPHMRD